jgi:Fe-S cluster assembly protein SufD
MSAALEQLAEVDHLTEDDYSAIRRHARQQLMQHGFPDLKTEAWKYTSLRFLDKREFQPQALGQSSAPQLPFDGHLLHFDQGQLQVEGLELPAGVRLEPLGAGALAAVDYGDRAGAFAWLNLASFQQAWRLIIETSLDQPLVLATTTSADFAAAVHPRLVIELAESASATLVEVQDDQGEGLVNIVQDIELGRSSNLRHLLYRNNKQSAWVQRTSVVVAADADYRFHALDLGGRMTRHDLAVKLSAGGALGEIDGVAFVDTKQHVDFHTAIEHQQGHTNSRESFRILADGSGVGVFNGRIHIHRGADDSHSDLNTANLLLSDSARINTKPELEIYAEEVTASHGATVGQLDDAALFYMRSRGIPASQASALLKQGFAATPLHNAGPAPVRDWLLEQLRKKFAAESPTP